MKKPFSILILFVTLIACKQTSKSETATEKVTKVVAGDQSEKVNKIPKETFQKREQTIEEFLLQLQNAVKSNDVTIIEKSLKFPFEFNSGGESSFYNNYQELKEDSFEEFSKILEAKFIGKDGSFHKARYYDSESKDYFVTYYFVKNADDIKLVSFAEPH